MIAQVVIVVVYSRPFRQSSSFQNLSQKTTNLCPYHWCRARATHPLAAPLVFCMKSWLETKHTCWCFKHNHVFSGQDLLSGRKRETTALGLAPLFTCKVLSPSEGSLSGRTNRNTHRSKTHMKLLKVSPGTRHTSAFLPRNQ